MDMFVHLPALHFLAGGTCLMLPSSSKSMGELGSERSWRMGPVLKDTQATEIRGDCIRCTQALLVGDPQVFLKRAERHLCILQTRTFTVLGH